jgi:hypothetical protein
MSCLADPPCRMCCKLEAVKELNKPMGKWCKHSCAGGCGIYAIRPKECETYSCLWLTMEERGKPMLPELKPSVCKAVITTTIGYNGILVRLDTATDWRRGVLGNFIRDASRKRLVVVQRGYNFKVVRNNIVVGEETIKEVETDSEAGYHFDVETMPLHPNTVAVP